MPLLGVITCEILELEFAFLLAGDTDIARITVLENRFSMGLIASLEARGVSPHRIPLLKGFTTDVPDRLEVLVQVLELALHNRKRFLQEGLVKATREFLEKSKKAESG
jgi:hypothetical protein